MLLAVAYDVGIFCFRQVAEHVGTEVLELPLVGTDEDVAVLESESFSFGIEPHAVCHVLHRDISVAPMEQDH